MNEQTQKQCKSLKVKKGTLYSLPSQSPRQLRVCKASQGFGGAYVVN